MAFQIANLKRSFKMTKDKKEIDLPDPNPNMSPEEVMKFYASEYPELTNATLNGPKVVGDRAEYVAKATVGTKG
jgi:PRTRC genetic system protein C